MNIAVTLRAFAPTDAGLVFSSWLRSYWDARPLPLREVPRELFFADRGHHGVVTRLIGRGAVVVACSDDPDEIYGWMCIDGRALHYVYVKELWRSKGVARALMASLPEALDVSHLTRAFIEGPGKRRRVTYNPYTLLECPCG